jgi:hypothetical protein
MTEAEKQALINQFNEASTLQRLAFESMVKLAKAIEAITVRPVLAAVPTQEAS